MAEFSEALPLAVLAVSGYVYLGVGGVLAYLGRVVWGRVMTLIGLVLGGTVGYSLGVLIMPGFGGFALALVGAMLGGLVFTWLVEVALAGMAGVLGLYVTYRTLLEYLAPDDALVVGILVLLALFSVAFYYMDRVMSYVTALVGAVLAAVGVFLLTADGGTSALVAAGMATSGSAIQELVVKRYEDRLRKRAQPASSPPPP